MNPEELQKRRRDKRLRSIGKKVERYKKQPSVTEDQIIELMTDAIWILGEMQKMHEESMKVLTCNKF